MNVWPLPSQFRHVVFPDHDRRRRAVVDLAPTRPATPVAPSGPVLPHDCAAFVQWLFAQEGLDARQYRPETLLRRLSACLRTVRARSPQHARQLLEATPALVSVAVNSLIIGVTSFFRDPTVFDLLRDSILPDLVRARGGAHVWSAGCSEGAELYSVAFLLAEAGRLGGSYLLGSDCRAEAVRAAAAGRYDPTALRAVPTPLRKYFERHADCWRVVPGVRHALRWRRADILKVTEPGVWDLILFRNTAMYLRGEAAALLWDRFEAALRPGGVLVLGKSERPLGAKRFAAVGPCLYRRTRG